jgi:tetratricopeptide (TPR) repeat protein
MNKKKKAKVPVKAAAATAKPAFEAKATNYNPRTLSLVLAGLAVALYANTISHNYALDDVAVIYQNKYTTQGLAGIGKMLTTFYWQGYWEFNAGLYRPLSLITFAIEWQLSPNNPHASHLVNVLLYALSSALLFTLLRRLLKNYNILLPFFCVLLYVAHPLHTEVVANIKSRDEILCFLFFIISANLLLQAIDTGKKNKLIASALTYFLCIFSKEGGLAFLAVFPLMLYFFRKLSLKESLLKTWFFLVPALIFLAIHTYVISHAPTKKITYTYLDNALVAAPDAASRLATAVYTAGDYLKLLFIPHPLSYDYSFNQIPAVTFASPQVLFTILVFALLIYFAVKKFKERNIYAFCILFYIITIAMVSNIVTLIGATFAIRFLFVPSLAFCLAIVTVGNKYLNRNLFIGIASVLTMIYSIRTITRNTDWKDNFTLFKADVKAAPGSARVHYNYGTSYLDSIAMKETDKETRKQLMQLPIQQFEEAVSIDPKAQDAFHNLAIAYYHSGNYAQSVQAGLSSLKYNPNNASTWSNLGNAYFRNGEYDKAIEALNKAINMGMIADDTYNFLGSSYFNKGDFRTAITMYNKALEKNPTQGDVLNNLASAYGSLGDFDNAITAFKKSLALNPDNAQTNYFLGLTYQNKGDATNAKLYFDKANALNKK